MVIPLNKRNTKNPEKLPSGHPICEAGLAMYKEVTLPDDYRLSIDRGSISFKKIYALRTESQRYNSRFKSTGQERLWIHGIHAARNLNTIAHIALLATAVAAVVRKQKQSNSIYLL